MRDIDAFVAIALFWAATALVFGLALRHIARTNPRREAEYQATLNDRADMWAGRPQDQRPEDRA